MTFRRRKVHRATLLSVLVASLVALIPVSASAGSDELSGLTYGAEYIQYWNSSCTPNGSGLGTLVYSKKLVERFAARFERYGGYKKFLYGNALVWAIDLIDSSEQRFVANQHGVSRSESEGLDHRYADTVDMYIYCGHGGRYSNTDQYFQPMCVPSWWSDAKKRAWLTFESENARFGNDEKGLRWMMLYTCHGIEGVAPGDTWQGAAGTSFEYLMAFSGLSWIGDNTDEVAEDWVDNAVGDNDTFKQAWFDAASDWYYDLSPGVVAFDDSVSRARYRREYQRYYWAERNGHYSFPAWASSITHN